MIVPLTLYVVGLWLVGLALLELGPDAGVVFLIAGVFMLAVWEVRRGL